MPDLSEDEIINQALNSLVEAVNQKTAALNEELREQLEEKL